jgi:hypothetical protein
VTSPILYQKSEKSNEGVLPQLTNYISEKTLPNEVCFKYQLAFLEI